MDQRKLMDNANTITDMAKVIWSPYFLPTANATLMSTRSFRFIDGTFHRIASNLDL